MRIPSGAQFQYARMTYTVTGLMPVSNYESRAYKTVNDLKEQVIWAAGIREGIYEGKLNEQQVTAYRSMQANRYF
jgi:hypothetical protein